MIPTLDTVLKKIDDQVSTNRQRQFEKNVEWMRGTDIGKASTHYLVSVTTIYGPSQFFISILPGGSFRYTLSDLGTGVMPHVRLECERIVRVVDNHNLTMAAGSAIDGVDRVGIIVHPHNPRNHA